MREPYLNGAVKTDTRRRQLVTGAACAGLAAVLLRPAPSRAADLVTFEGMYKSFGVLGLAFADRTVGLNGRDVLVQGYMAPPLKAESTFFVLTREPLAICPFCQSDADWPLDIVVVYLQGQRPLVPAGVRLSVSGRLRLGSFTDPDTGFVSQVRITGADYSAI